jgi:hypothetical protein
VRWTWCSTSWPTNPRLANGACTLSVPRGIGPDLQPGRVCAASELRIAGQGVQFECGGAGQIDLTVGRSLCR